MFHTNPIMKGFLLLIVLLFPALSASAEETDESTRVHIKGGITSYSSGFCGPAQVRRNRFFTDNVSLVPGRPDRTLGGESLQRRISILATHVRSPRA